MVEINFDPEEVLKMTVREYLNQLTGFMTEENRTIVKATFGNFEPTGTYTAFFLIEKIP